MKRVLCSVVIAMVVFGCSGDGDPVAVVAEDDGYLAREYVQIYHGQPYTLFTATLYLSLRFEPGLSTEDVKAFLKKRGLRIERDPDPTYRLYVVAVDNAFAQAAALAASPEVIYVGPVFWRSCGTHFLLVGNQFIVYGDATDAAVDSLLQEENATLVRARTEPANAVYYVFEIPWGPADHLFDLCRRVEQFGGVSDAEPNFVLPCQ